jgi:hypothetical protein
MQISAVSKMAAYLPPARAEAAEGAKPDRDGDADDAPAVRSVPTAASRPGRVDTYA